MWLHLIFIFANIKNMGSQLIHIAITNTNNNFKISTFIV